MFGTRGSTIGEFKITREGTVMRVLAVATGLWLLTGATFGAGKIPVHMLNGQVNDAANALSIEDQQRLSKLLRDYETETKRQVAVLIVPTLAGEAIESFCLRTAKARRRVARVLITESWFGRQR